MPNVGRFEPGESYIYERADGVTYARKLGDPPDARFEVGRVYSGTKDRILEDQLWHDIRLAAEHIPALQEALDRAKVIYELSRQDQTVDHHPV
jgi:predicted phosphoribosyltransferase